MPWSCMQPPSSAGGHGGIEPGTAGAGGVGHGFDPPGVLQVESLTGTNTLWFRESAATECDPANAGSCTSAITVLELASITATQELA